MWVSHPGPDLTLPSHRTFHCKDGETHRRALFPVSLGLCNMTPMFRRLCTSFPMALRCRRVIREAVGPLRLGRAFSFLRSSPLSRKCRKGAESRIRGGRATRVLLAVVMVTGGPAIGSPSWAETPVEDVQKTDDNKQKTEASQQKIEENRQKEAEEVERLQDLFLRSQFVFIRKGEVIVEYNFLYSTDSRIIPVGSAQAIKTSRRFLDNILLARFGLANGLELDVSVPFYIRAEQNTDFGLVRVPTQAEGVGDVSGALRYQVWYEKGSRPSLTVEANFKSHTAGDLLVGTGQYNVGGAIDFLTFWKLEAVRGGT